MKNILFLLLLIVSFSFSYGQERKNKLNNEKIVHFVKSAVREYTLDLKQYKQLLRVRRKYIRDYTSVSKDIKEGKIPESQKKTKIAGVNKSFTESFSKITGRAPRDLEPFNIRMRKELKKIKL